MKQPAETVLDWLRSNLGSAALGPLTGSDTRALRAAVQIIEQFAYDRDPSLLAAFRCVVGRMLPHNQELAFHAIAHVLNWDDRIEIWSVAFAARPSEFKFKWKCSFEPGGCYKDLAEEEVA